MDQQIKGIISECCNAFLAYVDGTCICSNCGQVIKQIDEDEQIVTSIHYQNNDTYDLQKSDYQKDKRLANDITCELSAVKCDKCGSLTRLTRDSSDKHVCVCIKCRNVFSFN